MPKILIGCVTYDGHARFLNDFLESLSKIPSINLSKDLILADNSPREDYSLHLRSKGLNALWAKSEEKDTRISRIIHGRNMVRDFFLKSDCDFLLFVDSDVMLPPNAIEGLLACDSDISSGIYLGNQEIKGKLQLIPTVYKRVDDENAKTVPINEIIPKKIFDIAVCGLGCALISRKVFEKISFHRLAGSPSEMDKEDVAFCLDARKEGFSMKANTAVKCGHYIKFKGKDALLKIKEE